MAAPQVSQLYCQAAIGNLQPLISLVYTNIFFQFVLLLFVSFKTSRVWDIITQSLKWKKPFLFLKSEEILKVLGSSTAMDKSFLHNVQFLFENCLLASA